MTKCFTRIRALIHRNLYVTVCGKGNSLTLSKGLYEHMNVPQHHGSGIFVFAVNGTFGFCFQDASDELKEAAVNVLAVNEEYGTVGFDLVNPTAARMLYTFNLPADGIYRLSVLPKKKGKLRYYEIVAPSRQQR